MKPQREEESARSHNVPPPERIATFDNNGTRVGGQKAMLEIVTATCAGMTTEEFEKVVKDWTLISMEDDWKRIFAFE